jgi:ATP-dependent RNA helicase DeaD
MPFSLLPDAVAQSLAARGYAEPTPVQAAVLQDEAVGRDLLVSAQTGSGKTVAFGVAMAADLLNDGVPPAGAPLALAIAPTRELALQVSRELAWLYEKAGLRIATCVGGMDPSKERRQLNHGAHIVVGTPGRLRDHLERGALDLSSLRFVVLDEADEMLDMGFREDLEELLDATPAERRTLLFSATMPRPIAALAKQYQRDALRISTIDERQGHGDISYQAVAVSPNDIENAVINLLRFHEAETAMLFCATRDNVRRLHATLLERGFAAVALSGEHSQNERNQAIQALRDGRARICVATDVAARGIDIPSLSLVIHVEVPRDAKPCNTARAAPAAPVARARRCWWCPIRAAAAWKKCCAARGSRRNGCRPRRSPDPRARPRAPAGKAARPGRCRRCAGRRCRSGRHADGAHGSARYRAGAGAQLSLGHAAARRPDRPLHRGRPQGHAPHRFR